MSFKMKKKRVRLTEIQKKDRFTRSHWRVFYNLWSPLSPAETEYTFGKSENTSLEKQKLVIHTTFDM